VLPIALLAIAVVTVVLELPGPLRWVAPAALAGLCVATDAAGLGTVRESGQALRDPLLFLAFAVPLAILLDRLGLFRAVAQRVPPDSSMGLRFWVLGAVVTAVLNLDTAVVLLTPLAIEAGRRAGRDAVPALAFGPVLLASLASSPLPVSNLTNLIAVERWDAPATVVLRHLGAATLVGIVVGWLLLRRHVPTADVLPGRAPHAVVDERRALRIGLPMVALLAAGFTLGDATGVPAWVVVAVVDAALCLVVRSLPWRHVPLTTCVMVLGLGVLATAAGPELQIGRLLGSEADPIGVLRAVAVAALLAAAINNLPAVLLLSAAAPPSLRWAVLLGVNVGPVLTLHGSLAGLLWQQSARAFGVSVSARDYARTGWRVGLPSAFLSALVVATF
jgi:arsenical pump membrane protein